MDYNGPKLKRLVWYADIEGHYTVAEDGEFDSWDYVFMGLLRCILTENCSLIIIRTDERDNVFLLWECGGERYSRDE